MAAIDRAKRQDDHAGRSAIADQRPHFAHRSGGQETLEIVGEGDAKPANPGHHRAQDADGARANGCADLHRDQREHGIRHHRRRDVVGCHAHTGVNAPVATPWYTQGAFTIGVTPIGVHTESAAPLTSRRQLHTDVPAQGTQLGSQTQIGPEIVTAISGVPVTSRDPNILIGADTARFRADALAIILADVNHPLAALVDYVNRDWVARPYQYGNMRLWEQNPVDWQAGHGISNNLGGADVIILQSTYRNQIQSARLERHGAVSKDEYYNIRGIAVDPLTAWDLHNRGLLPLPPTSYPKFKL